MAVNWTKQKDMDKQTLHKFHLSVAQVSLEWGKWRQLASAKRDSLETSWLIYMFLLAVRMLPLGCHMQSAMLNGSNSVECLLYDSVLFILCTRNILKIWHEQ